MIGLHESTKCAHIVKVCALENTYLLLCLFCLLTIGVGVNETGL